MIEPHFLIGCSLDEAEQKIDDNATIMVIEKDGVSLPHIMNLKSNRYKVTITNNIIQTCTIG